MKKKQEKWDQMTEERSLEQEKGILMAIKIKKLIALTLQKEFNKSHWSWKQQQSHHLLQHQHR